MTDPPYTRGMRHTSMAYTSTERLTVVQMIPYFVKVCT
jgi:hypothetical protein